MPVELLKCLHVKLFRNNTDELHALGNTTAATGKGFANASAVLSSLSILAAFAIEAKILTYENKKLEGQINLLDPYVLVGILIGGLLP